MFFTKKWFLALIAFIFLLAMFIDQNTVPVPIKFFMTGPFKIHLSVIIGASMLIGAMFTVICFVLFRQAQSKRRKRRLEDEVPA
jgi:uncharacterized integral membrane protein